MTTASLVHPLRWEKVHKKQSLSFPLTLSAIELIHFSNHTLTTGPYKWTPQSANSLDFRVHSRVTWDKKSMAAHRFRLLLPQTVLVETTLTWDKTLIILRSCSENQHSHSLQTLNKAASCALPILAHTKPSILLLFFSYLDLSLQKFIIWKFLQKFPTKSLLLQTCHQWKKISQTPECPLHPSLSISFLRSPSKANQLLNTKGTSLQFLTSKFLAPLKFTFMSRVL